MVENIAKDFGTHFLRNDTEIRKSAEIEPHEAYSLFRREPYGRLHVFAGPFEWAIEESEKLIRQSKSTCYLSNDFSQINLSQFSGILIAPEALLSGPQIQIWVANLREEPKIFATNSLYLLRELDLQHIPTIYINIIDGKIQPPVENIDCLSNLEILDRELEQSDRLLNINT